MISIHENTLIYNQTTYTFSHKILEALCMDRKLLVVFDPYESRCPQKNLCCFSLSKELLWQIAPPEQKAYQTALPFVGVSLINGQCYAVDFSGRSFSLDLQTGTITGQRFVK